MQSGKRSDVRYVALPKSTSCLLPALFCPVAHSAEVRRHHLDFNQHLHRTFVGQRFVPAASLVHLETPVETCWNFLGTWKLRSKPSLAASLHSRMPRAKRLGCEVWSRQLELVDPLLSVQVDHKQ